MGGREIKIKKMKRMMEKKKVVVVVRMEGMIRVCMEMVIHPPVLMKPRGKTCLCVFVGRDAPAHAHSLTGHVYVYVSSLSLLLHICTVFVCVCVCVCGNTCVCVCVCVCECTCTHASRFEQRAVSPLQDIQRSSARSHQNSRLLLRGD